MAHIYCIYNDINDKIYVGKTNFDYLKRFNEHLNDSAKRKYEKRPLYNAMNKYGIEKFHVMLLEECTIEEASILEQEWINKLHTYKDYGYNATKGGDGKCYIDYDTVLELWNKKLSISEIAKQCNCTKCSISTFLKNNYITTSDEIKKRSAIKFQLSVVKISKDGHIINVYNSIASAASDIQGYGQCYPCHISKVCKNIRKTAYGYKWKYLKDLTKKELNDPTIIDYLKDNNL